MAPPTRLLTISADLLYLQAGRQLILADARNGETISSWKLPFTGWQHLNRWLIRLRRLGVQSLVPLPDNKAVIVDRNRIYRLNLESGRVEGIFGDYQGKRPLFICQAKTGDLYFGEYFNNPDRNPVHIYVSRDRGMTFERIYTFSGKSIRHVHGVFPDSYSGGLWVTTGDDDNESWIWYTADDFQTLEPVIGGGQQYRAVQLLFDDEFIYFGSDSPHERNFLSRLDRRTGAVERLQEIQGTVLYGAKVGDYFFFSSVVEPSAVNRDKNATLWGSRDGSEWQVIKQYRKDPLPMKLFQYGQIKFPVGNNQTGNLWFTPFSTADDQTAQCLPVEDLFTA